VLAARGQWDAAEAHAEATRRASEMLGDASGVGYAATAGAWLAHCRGNPDSACDAVQPALALPNRDGIDEPGVLTWLPLYVEALIALSRLEEAHAALAPYARRAADRAPRGHGRRRPRPGAARSRGRRPRRGAAPLRPRAGAVRKRCRRPSSAHGWPKPSSVRLLELTPQELAVARLVAGAAGTVTVQACQALRPGEIPRTWSPAERPSAAGTFAWMR
jgi:hypothetical protein